MSLEVTVVDLVPLSRDEQAFHRAQVQVDVATAGSDLVQLSVYRFSE